MDYSNANDVAKQLETLRQRTEEQDGALLQAVEAWVKLRESIDVLGLVGHPNRYDFVDCCRDTLASVRREWLTTTADDDDDDQAATDAG